MWKRTLRPAARPQWPLSRWTNADHLRYEHGQPVMDQVICNIANQWKKHYDTPGSRTVCRLHGGVLLIACKGMDAAALAGEMRRHYVQMPCDCVAARG